MIPKSVLRAILPAALVALAAGCSEPALPEATLHEVMTQTVAPQAQAIWDISNKAFDETGATDASLLKPEDWTAIVEAARTLGSAAGDLSSRTRIVVAKPGDRLQDDDQPHGNTAEMVQSYIDKDFAEFPEHADLLVSAANDISVAAEARNIEGLSSAASALDSVCEDCHGHFWYPNQQ